LLNCRRRDIESARGEAMKILSDADTDRNTFEEALQAWWLIYGRKSVFQTPLSSRMPHELKNDNSHQRLTDGKAN
jgi:hypothetical protein